MVAQRWVLLGKDAVMIIRRRADQYHLHEQHRENVKEENVSQLGTVGETLFSPTDVLCGAKGIFEEDLYIQYRSFSVFFFVDDLFLIITYR